MMRVAVLGLGHWGRNWVRTLSQLPEVKSLVGVDISQDQRLLVQEEFPGVDCIEIGDDIRAVLQDPSVDAVIVATPASTHVGLAIACLQAKKHILVEKPTAMSTVEAARLWELAKKQGVVLMAGHTALFTPEAECVRRLLEQGDLGEPIFFESYHGNFGIVRRDASVLWDLGPHPVSLLVALLDPKVNRVQASGLKQSWDGLDTCYMSLTTAQGATAQMTVTWRSPIKRRHWAVGGTRRTVLVDELAPANRVQIFDIGMDLPHVAPPPAQHRGYRNST
ncbi:MAG: Gfo/Idh/MocA family oxidoreductase [Firmicutes bacterium]|nr:Gfo/Idh/MocA family oxidoreductase [Bacillota bacterium]